MSNGARTFRLIFVAALVVLLSGTVALAQCPLCRAGLDHAGEATARTMNLAIVVLLIPPVSIFCTIFAVAYKKRKGDDDDEEQSPEP
ncbi:MAG: hypothetical protein QOJ76_2358 [Acidobacteriota bacterium]|jgi:heme/copper-type cytochrome/quinol oxidase subunit 2|nr:hypothetical protein [Acidobacteriota bacterium]